MRVCIILRSAARMANYSKYIWKNLTLSLLGLSTKIIKPIAREAADRSQVIICDNSYLSYQCLT